MRAAFALDRGNTAIWGSIDNRLVEIWESALAALGNEARAERARLLAILARELLYAPLERRDPLCDEALSIAAKLDEPDVPENLDSDRHPEPPVVPTSLA